MRDDYRPGTTLDRVLRLYEFDKRLRVHLIEAIEAIDMHTRTQLAYQLANAAGPFATLEPANLSSLSSGKFGDEARKLHKQIQRSWQRKEDFLVHFFGPLALGSPSGGSAQLAS